MQNEFIRKCPVCGIDITYKNKNIYSRKFDFKRAEKNKYPCKKCQSNINYQNPNIAKNIGEKLKRLWNDPTFRNKMLKNIKFYSVRWGEIVYFTMIIIMAGIIIAIRLPCVMAIDAIKKKGWLLL